MLKDILHMFSLDAHTLDLVVSVIGTLIIPVVIWFATYTTGRLRAMELRIESLQDAKSTMVTRDEFNGRMDTLTNLILNNLPNHKGP
jgi:hypothetical protein